MPTGGNDPLAWLLVGGCGLLLATVVWAVLRRRRLAGDPAVLLRRACPEMLSDIFLGDGADGHVWIEHVLVSGRQIIVVDVRHVHGHVFGADAMKEWTVLGGHGHHTFANPQAGLWDRVAAIQRLLPEASVAGYVVFPKDAHFPKGRPRDVVGIEELLPRLDSSRRDGQSVSGGTASAEWEILRGAVTRRV